MQTDHNLLKVTQATSRIWNPGFPMWKHLSLKVNIPYPKEMRTHYFRIQTLVFHNLEYLHKFYCLTVYNLKTQYPKSEICF